MSIGPDIEKWKRRFVLCLFFALGSLLLTGANEANQEFHLRPARLQAVSRHWQSLVVVLAREAPGLTDLSAPEVKDNGAMLLIKACNRPSAVRP